MHTRGVHCESVACGVNRYVFTVYLYLGYITFTLLVLGWSVVTDSGWSTMSQCSPVASTFYFVVPILLWWQSQAETHVFHSVTVSRIYQTLITAVLGLGTSESFDPLWPRCIDVRPICEHGAIECKFNICIVILMFIRHLMP